MHEHTQTHTHTRMYSGVRSVCCSRINIFIVVRILYTVHTNARNKYVYRPIKITHRIYMSENVMEHIALNSTHSDRQR